jgi:hypothetical protein
MVNEATAADDGALLLDTKGDVFGTDRTLFVAAGLGSTWPH